MAAISSTRRTARRRAALTGVVAAVTASATLLGGCVAQASGGEVGADDGVKLPPVNAGFDYQIGGAYTPPSGVEVVTRDRADEPAKGAYNVCYVNAFQAQRGHNGDWDDDLLLRDENGDLVIDKDWKEALLDISTPKKRERVAKKVNGWIDGCADKGYDAIEPDNYDSYTRSKELLTSEDAEEFSALLTAHAHEAGLAVGQKNTSELAGNGKKNGYDFAVAEECGQYNECGVYAKAFADHVLVIEYKDAGMTKACDAFGDRLSIVRRDVDVVAKGEDGYVRETC